MRRIGSAFAVLLLSCLAQAQRQTPMSFPTAEDQLRSFLQNYDKDGAEDGYFPAFVDLNGDGEKEAIVYLVGQNWCGSGGCPTLVLAPKASSYRVVTRIFITRPPIRVLTTSSNGWRTLTVWVSGGGIQPGYEAELRFDGKTYPMNPSVPPARRLREKVEGEVIIPDSANDIRNDKPLYPEPTADQTGAAESRPSFNCASSKTPTEKLVCRDAELASLDRGMALAYRSALQELPTERATALRREQQEWLREYARACDSVASEVDRRGCVVQHLGSRTRQLTALIR